MASEKHKAASRANGADRAASSLPKGKLRSSHSIVERGMIAAFMTWLPEELKPGTPIENLLIHEMAVAHWRLMRVWGMERCGHSQETGPPESPDAPTRDALTFGKSGVHLNEYEMRFDRQFTRALDRFEKFRASRTRHVQQTKTPEVEQ
jgi:hypothetical protein